MRKSSNREVIKTETNMRSPIFCFFFILVIFAVVDAADIVSDTCKKIAQGDNNVHVDFCVKALGADPKSKSADLQGLGIISSNLVVNNAVKISSHIGQLLNDKKLGPDVKIRLKDCQERYSDAIANTKEAIGSFNSKDYSTANIKLSSALDAARDCEDGFKEKPGLKSPLTAENNDFFELAAIALAFTNLVR